MSNHHPTRLLFRNAAVEIEDYVCRPATSALGRTEVSDGQYIVFVRRGAFEKRCGNRSVVSTAASLTFFNCGEEYRVAHPRQLGDDCTAIKLNIDSLHEFVGSDDRLISVASRLPELSCEPASSELFAQHWRLLSALQHNDDPADLEEKGVNFIREVLKVAITFCKGSTFEHAPPKGMAIAQRAVEFLAENYTDNHSIASIAKIVGSSPYYLCRIFRNVTGYSICDFRNHLRLREAMYRLSDGENNLLKMSLELGFSHHGHMGRKFKRSFGVTPSQFRKECAR